MKSTVKVIIFSLLACSLVFTNDVKTEVISKADLESKMLNDITTTKDVSISNKIEEIGKPIEATLINGQDSPKGVDFKNYKPLYEVKEADNGGYNGTTYINPDYVSTSRSSAITVEIISGGYGSEMDWNLTAADGTVVASGGPYSNCSSDTITLDLADGDYTFNAIDTYGDGWNSSWSCDYQYGSYAVYDADGALLAGTDGVQYSQVVTGTGSSETFTVQEPVPATAEVVVTVYAGGYGSEMAWSLSDSSGEVAAGGSMENCAIVTETLTLGEGDYTFSAVDSYGDGWNGSYCGGVLTYGSYSVTVDGELVAGLDGSQSTQIVFGSGTTESFSINLSGVGGCMESTACNFNADATFDDGSCVVPGDCDTCEDTCSDGTSLDQASCEAATCSGVDGWDETEAGCDNSQAQVGTAQVGTPASDDYVAPQDNTLVWTEGGTCSDGVATSEEDCDNSSEQVGTPASDDYQAAVENTLVWTDAVAGSCSDGVAESAEDCDNSVPQVGTAASDDYAPNSATFTAGAAGSCSDGVATSAEDCDNSTEQVGTAASCEDTPDWIDTEYGDECEDLWVQAWCSETDANGVSGHDACCQCGGGTNTPASDDYQAAVENTLVWTDASADSCSAPTGNVDSCYPNDGFCDDGYSWCGGLTGVDCTDCGNCESDVADWDGTESGCDNGAGTPASDDFVAAVENTLVWTDAVAGSCSDGVAESAEDCDNSSAQVGTAASDDYAPAQENTLEWTTVGSCSDEVSTSQEDCDNSVAQVGTPASDDYAPASDDYAPAVENSAVYYGGGMWSIMTDGDSDDDGVCNDLDQCADADDNGGACECALDSATSTAAVGYYSFTSFQETCADADGFGANLSFTSSGTSYLYLQISTPSLSYDCASGFDLYDCSSLTDAPSSYALNVNIELEAGECVVWQGYDWYGYNSTFSYPDGTALTAVVSENTDPALTGCMEPLACDYDEAAIYEGDCDFPDTGFDCDDNCIGVPDDPNTADIDETLECGCTDWFANNYDSSAIGVADLCNYDGMVELNWNLTSATFGSEIRHYFCTTGDDGSCIGYTGVSNNSSYDLTIHILDDGTEYEVKSRDSYGDGWHGGSWSITDLDGNVVLEGTPETCEGYTSSYVYDSISSCSAGYDCAGVCNGDSLIDDCGLCGGLNASYDCAGTCTGDLSSGTWINGNPGSDDPTLPPFINGSADDGSWSLSDCYYTPGSGVNTPNEDGTVSITAEYSTGDCMFTSSVFNGQVSAVTSTTHNADMSLVGAAGFTLSGGANFTFSSTGTYVDFTADGSLTGDLPGGLVGGLVNDCTGECDGAAYLDFCEDCVGGTTGLEECVADCAGIFEGQEGYGSDFDACGACDNYADSDGVQPAYPYGTCDCEGTPGGSVVIDDCGTCGGLNAAQDCFGDCDGIGFLTDEGACAYPAFDAITDLAVTTSDTDVLRVHLTWTPVTTEDANGDGYSDASYGVYVYDENYFENCPFTTGIGDGWCDANRNNEDCGWDMGDCCPSDCTDGTYSCASWGGDCDDCADPSSIDLAADDGTGNPGDCWVPYTCGDGVCDSELGEVGGDSGCVADCGCNEGEFECVDGSSWYGDCISGSWACDGGSDCTNGTDELDCPVCGDGICEGDETAGAGSSNCFADCGCGDDILCSDGSACLDADDVCDGSDDCTDGEDESDCAGVSYCGDGTCDDDETPGDYSSWSNPSGCYADCGCNEGEFDCAAGGSYGNCFYGSWECDGYNDCSDSSDEADCGLMSSNDSGELLSEDEIYNFIIDNSDGSLENNEIKSKMMDMIAFNNYMSIKPEEASNDGFCSEDDTHGNDGTRAGWRRIGSAFYYHYSDGTAESFNLTSSAYNYNGEAGPYRVTSRNLTLQESAPSNEVSGIFPDLAAPENLRALAGEGLDEDQNPTTYINFNWDYDGYEPAPYADCSGTISYIGDGDCDTYNNNAECDWDGGDCCQETCTPGTTYFCDESNPGNDTADIDNDGCWDLCYDPDTSCGSGVPTCALDYSDLNFAVVAGLCYLNSNTYVLTWNDGCDGEIWLDGEYLFSSSDYTPPLTRTGFGPDESHLWEFKTSDGETVAGETENTSNEDCSGDALSGNNDHVISDTITSQEMKMSINPPSEEEYRLAEGFRLFSRDDAGDWALEVSSITDVAYTLDDVSFGCFAVAAYDSSPSFESEKSNEVCIDPPSCALLGDSNEDGVVNVSDIVLLVGAILNNAGSSDGVECGDADDNGIINVSDIVSIVNVILNGRVASIDDATESTIIISDNALRVEANGFVQGVQITLSHGDDFSINLVDAYISEYKTSDNMTTLVVVTDGSSSLNEIASINGNCKIEDVHVASSIGDVAVEEIVELANFQVDVVGPNPFNPSTQLNIVVPDAGYVSVKVYNILGQEVANLVDGYMEASNSGYMVNWNAGNLASGVYIVRAATAGQISTQKLMLLK